MSTGVTGVVWGKCQSCGVVLTLKRLSGRRPKYCNQCRQAIQDKWKNKEKE